MNPSWIGSVVASVAGLSFAAVSTYDFVAHLDRQVHGLHCSLLMGAGAADVSGTSGCHVAMMSPYSSVFRETLWGGLPISLPAMAVFAFLLGWALVLRLEERLGDRAATGFFALGSLLPLLSSVVMGGLSLSQLGTVCMLCLGIYLSSIALSVCAFMLWRQARSEPVAHAPLSRLALAGAFVLGCVFVLLPSLTYAVAAPDFSRYAKGCGSLHNQKGSGQVLIPLSKGSSDVELVEVLDPLCPACAAFEARFSHLEVAERASRNVLLFPLDDACNWMVDSAVHPGACAVSEAVLCAKDGADEVIDWAFQHQEEVVQAEREKQGSAARMVTAQFPSLKGCVGSAKARAELNQSLRWAVARKLPVLTPQLYVNGTRLCDADTDIGLDYTLTRLAKRAAH